MPARLSSSAVICCHASACYASADYESLPPSCLAQLQSGTGHRLSRHVLSLPASPTPSCNATLSYTTYHARKVYCRLYLISAFAGHAARHAACRTPPPPQLRAAIRARHS